MKISYGKNVYNNEEINAVLKKLKQSTQMGDAVEKFEKKIARMFSKKIWTNGKFRILCFNFSHKCT